MAWSNFKSHFTKRGRLEEERVNLLVDRLSISGEYISTFRTKSYVEMWKKAHLGTSSRLDRLGSSSSPSPSPSLSSSSSVRLPVHLCDNLLEPRQETLLEMIESSDLHPLIGDFVDATFEASKICELLIHSVVQVRANYRIIQRVIMLAKNTLSHPDEIRSSIPKRIIHVTQNRQSNYSILSSYRRAESVLRREELNHEDIESLTYADYTDDQCHAILKDFASFTMLKNPLESISPSKFRDMHDSQGYLLRNLSIKCRKVKRRRANFTISCKKAVVLACSLELVHKGKKTTKRWRKTNSLERLAQLEVARKGVYFLKNDFDTLSLLMRRLKDGIERIKDLSDMCVSYGKMGVVNVVSELGMDQKGFLEKLEDLEKQIILCFLDINRSRKKLLDEIMVLQQEYI